MSLDPSIILGASQKLPQFQSPIDTFQKAMGLRELMNQAQISDMQAQAQQQQFGDQQSLRTLLQGNSNPTASQIYNAAPSATGTAFLNSMNEYKMNQAKLTSAQADVAEKSADFLSRGAQLVQKSNYDPNVAIQTLKGAAGTPFEQQANGLIQQIQQNPSSVKTVFDGLAANAESLKDQQAAQSAATQANARQQQADAATAKTVIDKANSDKANGAKDLATVGSLFGNAQNQNDWSMAFAKAQAAGVSKSVLNAIPTAFSLSTAQTMAKQAMTPDQAAQLQQGAQRNQISQQDANIAAGRLGEERRHNGITEQMSNGQQWNTAADIPPAQAAYVDRVFNGKDVAPGPNSKQRGAFNTAMSILHPDYDFTTGVERKATAGAISSGQMAQNSISLNTQVGHISEALGALNQMGNTNIQAVNQVAQAWGRQTGRNNVTDFDTFKSAVGSETAKALGDFSQTERDAWQAKIANASSPAILRSRLVDLARVAAQRAGAQQDQVRRVGKIADYQVYSPQNRKVLSDLGIDPDGGTAAPGQQQQSQQQATKPVDINALRSKYKY